MFNAVYSLYKDVSYSVRINGRLSPWFSVSQDVKQGCTLSPTLYQIYTSDCINTLNCGIKVGEKNLSVLLFADDIAIIAQKEEDLQRCLDVMNNWCMKWRLSINPSKSKIIHYRLNGSSLQTINSLETLFLVGYIIMQFMHWSIRACGPSLSCYM